MHKSSFLSRHLNYNVLKGYYGILPNNAKNILPTAALNVKYIAKIVVPRAQILNIVW